MRDWCPHHNRTEFESDLEDSIVYLKKKEQLTKTEALLQIGCYVYKSRSSERPDERETKSVCAWGF